MLSRSLRFLRQKTTPAAIGGNMIPHSSGNDHPLLQRSDVYESVHEGRPQMRQYAQKKAKSFKKQQQIERERARKNQKEAEMRKHMQFVARMKRQREKKELKGEAATSKPRVPKPLKKEALKIPVEQSNASHAKSADAFVDFISTYQNVDLENETAEVGFAGFEYLTSVEQLDKHILHLKSDMEEALALVEKKSLETDSLVKGEIQEILICLDRIEAPRREFARLREVVSALHYDPEFVTRVVSAEQQLLNFYNHRVDENVALYTVVNAITENETLFKPLPESNQNFLRRLVAQFKLAGLHLENRTEFLDTLTTYNTNLAAYLAAINASSEVIIEKPSRLFQLPRDIYNGMQKRQMKKKARTVTVDFHNHLLPILNHVSNEKVRKQVYTTIHSTVTSKDNLLNQTLDKLANHADQLAKFIGYDGVGIATLKMMGIESEDHLDNVATLLSQLISGLNAQKEIDILADLKKNLNEITKTKDELEPFDTRFLWEQHRNDLRKYDNDAVREFFPLSRCLEGTATLFRDLLNVEIRQAKLGPEETWGPRTVKKLELMDITSGDRIGIVYLDLFNRVGDERKPEMPTSYVVPQLQGTSKIPVTFISMRLGDSVLSMQPQLSHDQLRAMLREFGTAAANVLLGKQVNYNTVKDTHNPILSKMLGFVMERYAYSSSHLKSFAKHKGAHTTILEEYIADLISVPPYSRLEIIDEAVVSLFDTQLFDKSGSKKPVDMLLKLENNFAPLQLTPKINNWKAFNGAHYVDLYAKLLSSHVWHTIFQKGDPAVRSNASAKLQAVFADEKLDTESGIEALIGQKMPNVKFFLEDLDQPQGM